jgi:hypothetical protein
MALHKKYDFRFAAVPPSVRKASGFPGAESNLNRGYLPRRPTRHTASIEAKVRLCGKAQPFRTDSGEAANLTGQLFVQSRNGSNLPVFIVRGWPVSLIATSLILLSSRRNHPRLVNSLLFFGCLWQRANGKGRRYSSTQFYWQHT